MKVKFEAKFAKDLRAIRDPKVLNKIQGVIADCKSAMNLSELNHVKKMQGYEHFYRIRLGEYRIGIEIVEDEMIFYAFFASQGCL